MRRKIWMDNPYAGGTTIPREVREETEQRIRAYAERRHAGAFSRLAIRFHGPLCYIDAYVEPEPPSRRLLHVVVTAISRPNHALQRPGAPVARPSAECERSADRRTCTTAAPTNERAGPWGDAPDGSWLLSGIGLCMVNVWRA